MYSPLNTGKQTEVGQVITISRSFKAVKEQDFACKGCVGNHSTYLCQTLPDCNGIIFIEDDGEQ